MTPLDHCLPSMLCNKKQGCLEKTRRPAAKLDSTAARSPMLSVHPLPPLLLRSQGHCTSTMPTGLPNEIWHDIFVAAALTPDPSTPNSWLHTWTTFRQVSKAFRAGVTNAYLEVFLTIQVAVLLPWTVARTKYRDCDAESRSKCGSILGIPTTRNDLYSGRHRKSQAREVWSSMRSTWRRKASFGPLR